MELLTIQDVARLYGKTYKQVRYALVTGRLRGIKVGWQWLFRRDDLPAQWPERDKKKK